MHWWSTHSRFPSRWGFEVLAVVLEWQCSGGERLSKVTEMQKYREFMALHIGTMSELVVRQETTL